MDVVDEDLPQPVKAYLGRIRNVPPEDRADQAIKLAGEVVDLLGQVIQAHAANRIVSYSDRISSQVATSFAAHALNDLQRVFMEAEVLRLMRLWDPPDPSRTCIPTVYWLTLDPAVRAILDERNTIQPEPYDDYLVERQARQTWLWQRLDNTAPALAASDLVAGLNNFRNKRLAHWLVETKVERSGVVVKPAVYGDERRLLGQTIAVADVMGQAVRATQFNFRGMWRISRRNTQAFWHGVTVTPLR